MSNGWSERLKALPMTLLRGLICVLLVISFLLTALSFSVRDIVLNREMYRDVVRDPLVPARMVEYARVELEAECLFYGLPFEIIDEALTETEAIFYTVAYVDAVYDVVFGGGELEEPEVDVEVFREPIAALLEPEGIEAQVIDDLAAEFAHVTEGVWSFSLGEKLLTPLQRLCGHPLVMTFAKCGYLLGGVTVALAAVVLFLGRRRIRYQTFAVSASLAVGSMLLFVPLWLLKRYDPASRLVLGDTPLKILVDGAVRTINQQMLTMSTWMLVVTTLMTVAAIVWVVWPTPEVSANQE